MTLLMRVFTCVLLSSLLIGKAQGQGKNTALTDFAARANAGSEISFVFSATDNKAQEIYRESGKTIVYGNKYRMDVPDNLLVVSNGTSRWIYKPQEEELVIAANNPGEEDIMENPFAILNVKNGGTVKNYTVSVISRATGTGGKELQGVPDKIILTAKGGAKYTIAITGFKQIATPPATTFELDVKKYPNAIVTDLR